MREFIAKEVDRVEIAQNLQRFSNELSEFLQLHSYLIYHNGFYFKIKQFIIYFCGFTNKGGPQYFVFKEDGPINGTSLTFKDLIKNSNRVPIEYSLEEIGGK